MKRRPGETGERLRPPPLHVAIAWLYGTACHLCFVVGVGTMMITMIFGMTTAFGRVPMPWSWLANLVLLIQFPLIHSILLSTRGRTMLPRLAPLGLGRHLSTTTYALMASLQVLLLFAGWTPSGTVWWRASGGLFWTLCGCNAAAWLLLLKSIVDAGFALQTGLLGWRAIARGTTPRYPPMPVTGLFRICRQPIYVAFALTLWTVPTWTPDQLVVAFVLSAYCLVGPLFKEARFAQVYGAPFARYKTAVPYWVPGLKPAPRRSPPSSAPVTGGQASADPT
ncbi:isoprenylcysteine carboxylmethyltransferase family protein [Lichenihabitans sp. PAMC28606]|uniref:methyltransferase family protein n=1 Tax=Lichenihabitans sp. PAMC28606 TaxID=2880932 RepID=UPI001D0A0CF5|nr:isoprenylcysteine carboxylmethyltransferase family protein [Lichenihabitans sp. PAMC28606]UDL94424.1 isoprenylcysteine carboxylmethyltransferase family protein [Lichenihabitans sp. PAMC28606]